MKTIDIAIHRLSMIFVLTIVSLGAFADNPIKRLLVGADGVLQSLYNKVDYDTAYISRSPGKIGVKAWGNVSGAKMRAIGNDMHGTLKTDNKTTMSLEFDYYDLALELALNPASLSGRNKDYELNFNFYTRRFVLDVSYQTAKTAKGDVTYKGKDISVDKGWLSTKSLNFDAYYIFNYRNFSYDAPFYQFYIQKKSAGSWLAGLSYQGGRISTTDDVPGNIPEMHFKAQHIGIGGGYAYNFVTGKYMPQSGGRKWLFHFSVVPNIILWSGNIIEVNGQEVKTSTKFPTVLLNGRVGMVYFLSPSRFIGMNGVVNRLIKRKSHTELKEDKWYFRIFYGMRF